jgi:calcineurin-like phosphoesterase
MCGASASVIGMDPRGVLRRFLLQIPTRFEVAAGEPEAAGVFFEIDPETGRCNGVEPFVMSESRMRSADEWKKYSSP